MSDRTWVILELSSAGERVLDTKEISDSLLIHGADNVFVPAISANVDKHIVITWLMEGYVFADVRSYIIPRIGVADPWRVATTIKGTRSRIKKALFEIFKKNPGMVFTARDLVDRVLLIDPDCLTRKTHIQKQQVIYTALGRTKEFCRSSGSIKGRFWMGNRKFHPKDLEDSPFVDKLMCEPVRNGVSQIHYLSQSKVNQFRKNLQALVPQFEVGQFVRILGGIHRNLEGEVLSQDIDTLTLRIRLDTMVTEFVIPRLFVEPAT